MMVLKALNRPDPHWCRLHSRVSDGLPVQGLPPFSSFCTCDLCLAWVPMPQGFVHSDHALNSVHLQSTGRPGSISNLFLRGIFFTTNRGSFIGWSFRLTAWDLAVSRKSFQGQVLPGSVVKGMIVVVGVR